MKIATPKPPGEQVSTRTTQLPFTIDHELLIQTLREASTRADEKQRTVLASYTQPVEWHDTIQAFSGSRQAGLGECFFWELPTEQTTLIGIGAETTIETAGSACFCDSATAWRALMNDAVITYAPAAAPTPGSGPLLFGGFAFDPLSQRTQLWAEFPDGLLILPRFLLSYRANDVTLTVNSMMHAP